MRYVYLRVKFHVYFIEKEKERHTQTLKVATCKHINFALISHEPICIQRSLCTDKKNGKTWLLWIKEKESFKRL